MCDDDGNTQIQNVVRPTLSVDTLYEPRPYKEVDDFEAFCDELQFNKEIRDSYVSKRNVISEQYG